MCRPVCGTVELAAAVHLAEARNSIANTAPVRTVAIAEAISCPNISVIDLHYANAKRSQAYARTRILRSESPQPRKLSVSHSPKGCADRATYVVNGTDVWSCHEHNGQTHKRVSVDPHGCNEGIDMTEHRRRDRRDPGRTGVHGGLVVSTGSQSMQIARNVQIRALERDPLMRTQCSARCLLYQPQHHRPSR